jgi:hypothetical protein
MNASSIEHRRQPEVATQTGAAIGMDATPSTHNPLNAVFFDGHERAPIQPHAPPKGPFTQWLTVEQIRKMQRMRRGCVIEAMESGELPHERRGRIRYARLSDVLAWEERRLTHTYTPSTRRVAPELADLLG